MRPSNIELEGYFVTELNVSANMAFTVENPADLSMENLVAEPECFNESGKLRHWQIRLRIKNTGSKEQNTPYFFSIVLIGFFRVLEAVSEEHVADFAKVNGASILFGTAREILRTAMSQGPHTPILLPAVCFLDVIPVNRDQTP